MGSDGMWWDAVGSRGPRPMELLLGRLCDASRTVADFILNSAKILLSSGKDTKKGPRDRMRSGQFKTDSKSVARKGVWVQVPPPVLLTSKRVAIVR